IIATFSALMSTPTTSWPALARQAAVTDPTYPSPKTLTRMGEHLLAPGFEFGRNLRPRVPLLHEAPTCRTERPATGGIPQEGRHGAGELGRTVSAQAVFAGHEREALSADRPRDHRLGHRDGLQAHQSPAAAAPPRPHADARRH